MADGCVWVIMLVSCGHYLIQAELDDGSSGLTADGAETRDLDQAGLSR